MKLRYITTLVSACLMSSTVSAAEIYNKEGNKLVLFGKLSGVHYVTGDQENNGGHSYLRYGLSGQSYINQYISTFGEWEYEAKLSNSEDSIKRGDHTGTGFAGLNFGEFGSVNYGRNYGVLYDVASWTDIMQELGKDNTATVNNPLSGRATGIATYRNNNLFGLVDGLSVAIQYQGQSAKGNDYNNKEKGISGNSHGISLRYNLGNNLAIGSAYAKSKHFFANSNLTNNQASLAETYSLGMKYNSNNLYLAALYSQTHYIMPFKDPGQGPATNVSNGSFNKAYNIELAAYYEFDYNFRASMGYIQSRSDGSSKQNRHDTQKYVKLGTSYLFNDSMSAFIDYRLNLMKKDEFTRDANISTDNVFAVGANYLF